MTIELGIRPREIKGKRLARALDHLAGADKDLRRVLRRFGPPPPRRAPVGFPALLDIIVSQQVSAAAADAIMARLVAVLDGGPTPAGVLALGEAALRRAGLSRQKIRYSQGLAADLAAGRLDLDAVARLPDDAAVAALTRVKGIGRWSAEIYLLFALQRPDVLPADDLALMLAAQRLKGLAARPTPAALRAMGETWRPWRSVASRLLWHYYRHT